MARVLIIDDDEMIGGLLSTKLSRMGHQPTTAETAAQGLEATRTTQPDVVFLDVHLPDGNGLDLLPEIKQTQSAPEVIIFTGQGTSDGAELAIKSGAWDYIPKPASLQGMILPLLRALEYREQRSTLGRMVALKRDQIIGKSAPLKACLDLLAEAAPSEANILISGETGTGKELFAWAVHQNSPRAGRQFTIVDCASLPKTLAESTLFGHKRGAFTGADKDRIGLIQEAHQGTLFLDEIGELPLETQRVFLRVLQERRFLPVGGKTEIESDFRLVAATNRSLDKMVEEGTFREDLLYRLRSIAIQLPPLRDRKDDIIELVFAFLAEICTQEGKGTKGLSPDLLEALGSYSWPGNVRELRQALIQAVARAGSSPVLYPQHMPTRIRVHLAQSSLSQAEETPDSAPQGLPRLADLRQETDRQYLLDLIAISGGEIKRACEISGVSRSRLYALLKAHDLKLS